MDFMLDWTGAHYFIFLVLASCLLGAIWLWIDDITKN